jgi:hypothetical protein
VRRVAASSTRGAAKARTRTSAAADSQTRDVVRTALEDYAKRGVFSGFKETDSSEGHAVFSFVWLHDQPMELTLDASKRALRFERMLPGVKSGSEFAADLKRLIQSLRSNAVPDYRRVEPKRASLTCSNRQNHLTVAVAVKKNDYPYAVNRIVNVAHELFVYLRSAWPEYLMEYFNEPEE